jgi:Ca2+-binding EF-hand superfamily protein
MKRLVFSVLMIVGFTALGAEKKAGAMDVDSDGKVTRQEFLDARSKQAAEAGKTFSAEAQGKIFDAKDTNGDGVLNFDEVLKPAPKAK